MYSAKYSNSNNLFQHMEIDDFHFMVMYCMGENRVAFFQTAADVAIFCTFCQQCEVKIFSVRRVGFARRILADATGSYSGNSYLDVAGIYVY